MRDCNKFKHQVFDKTLMFFFLFPIFIPIRVGAEYVNPAEVNFLNPPLDSIQKTMWEDYPVIVHRRTQEQVEELKHSFSNTPSFDKRWLAYRSIARMKGNEFASAIMQFTETYISENNAYMSEIPEFGVYSMVSPILGCAVFKEEDGFIDPCYDIRFDLAGRVINHKGYEHLRLTIPPYKIVENKLEFLEDYKAKEVVDFTPDILNMNLPNIDKALLAIDFERLDLLKQIVEASPSVLSQRNSAGSTVLQLASIHDSTIDYVLSFENIQLDHINDAGYTALLFAIFSRKFENAEKLILRGARMEAFSLNGNSAKSVENFIVEDMYYEPEAAKDVLKHLNQLRGNNKLETKN